MVDTSTLTTWLAELGDNAPTIEENGAGTWTVSTSRNLTPKEREAWGGAPGSLAGAVEAIASGYPLVTSELIGEGKKSVVRFSSVLYEEGLGRQAFLLTASSVAKASEAIGELTRVTAEYASAIDELNRESASRTVATPTVESAPRPVAPKPVAQKPAPVATDTGACPNCGTPKEEAAKFCRKCGASLR